MVLMHASHCYQDSDASETFSVNCISIFLLGKDSSYDFEGFPWVIVCKGAEGPRNRLEREHFLHIAAYRCTSRSQVLQVFPTLSMFFG